MNLGKIMRRFGWTPVNERQYHKSFKCGPPNWSCIHHFNWEKYGQCPQCAGSAMRGINWSLVDKETLESLQDIIRASKEE